MIEKFLKVLNGNDLKIFRDHLNRLENLNRKFEIFVYEPVDFIENVIIEIYYPENVNLEEVDRELDRLYKFLYQTDSRTLLLYIDFTSAFEDV